MPNATCARPGCYGPVVLKRHRGLCRECDAETRYWPKVERRSDDECWPWLAYCHPAGYAQFWSGLRWMHAHRWAYLHFVGPIPGGYDIDHVKANDCVRRDCTNWVRHLEAVTATVNVMRSDCPAAVNARKTACDNGHDYTPETMHFTPGGKRHCRLCRNATEKRTMLLRVPGTGPNGERDLAIVSSFIQGTPRRQLAAQHAMTEVRIGQILRAARHNGLLPEEAEARFGRHGRRQR